MNTSLIFGILSGLFAVIFFAIYLRSILAGETKPHIYTMFLYVVITSVIFYSQIIAGAGYGAIYVGIIGLFWILIFIYHFGMEQRILHFG